MLKYKTYGIKDWDVHFTVPTFDFIFRVSIPEPNKERLILERDKKGRIVKSAPPMLY